MPKLLQEIKAIGFARVQNFPIVGEIDGSFRANLEETGMGYDEEGELVRLDREKDLLTTPMPSIQTKPLRWQMLEPTSSSPTMGLTTKGTIGAETAKSLDDPVKEVQAIADAARSVRDDVIVLCHGRPIAMPEDAEYVLTRPRMFTASRGHLPSNVFPSKLRGPNKRADSNRSVSDLDLPNPRRHRLRKGDSGRT